MKWVVSQIGRREDYFLARMFHREGELQRLYTDWWVASGHRLLRKAGGAIRDLTNRYNPEIPTPLTRAFNSRFLPIEVGKRLRPRDNAPTAMYDQLVRQARLYDMLVARDMGRLFKQLDATNGGGGRGFVGFCGECLQSLSVAASNGAFTVVDQYEPGRVEDELLKAELQRWPDWEPAHPIRNAEWYARVEAEWRAADLILVNSPYSRDCIIRQGAAAEKIIVVPLAYEAAPTGRAPKQYVTPAGAKRLSALWLGRVVLQKGIQYLLETALHLANEPIDFFVAGPISISEEAIAKFPPSVRFLGKVSAARKIELYSQCDVFVLPTLSEGFAITQVEAMSYGLPLVVTPNCGQVVSEGVDGFVIPARDGIAMADRLLTLHQDRPRLEAMSREAIRTSARFSLKQAADCFNREMARVDARPGAAVAPERRALTLAGAQQT